MRLSDILGINARNKEFSYVYNSAKGKAIAASKLLTKKYLKKAGVAVPEIYAKFKNFESVLSFDWNELPSSFALKPNQGLGGEGIIVVKRRAKDGNGWITTQRKRVTVDDLKLHASDILEGAFSMGNEPDIAYIEEYVGRHKAFRKYAYRGTPDIRVIVFNKVPVMAMLRLPTKESGGRANLHQGAIGVGVDIATGITTRAIWHGDVIKFKPGTKRKLHGIKIPQWNKILETAILAQQASFLGYVGVDVVLHPTKGPVVLEINSQPGLSIQMANGVGLRKRLEKVEDLKIRDAEHGIKVARALFAGPFADKVKAEEGIKMVDVFEKIKIKTADGRKVEVPAKIDTGAWSTSIDKSLAEKLGLLREENILWTKEVKSALGRERRKVINLVFWLGGRRIDTSASVSKRISLRFPVIIGRKSLKGMIVRADVDLEKKRELSRNFKI
jgi:alpha-L-glutamate ligase-like protein